MDHQFHEHVMQKTDGFVDSTSINASAILETQQRCTVRVMATATSCISITAALCSIFWFCMMKRNFRRDLVLLLIVGDFLKNFWLMVFSIYTFVHGELRSESHFCQASGYLVQVSLESCDLAVLFISLHMNLQIFPPSNSILGRDGLYHMRHWVFAAWVFVPNLMASLAFVNGEPAYMAAGAFCTLPVRPFWYRISLSWVPRYLIWIFVMGVAIRIYRHVGKEFKVFGRECGQSSSINEQSEPTVARATAVALTGFSRRLSTALDKTIKTGFKHPVQPMSDGLAPPRENRSSSATPKYPPSAVRVPPLAFKYSTGCSSRQSAIDFATASDSTSNSSHSFQPPTVQASDSQPGCLLSIAATQRELATHSPVVNAAQFFTHGTTLERPRSVPSPFEDDPTALVPISTVKSSPPNLATNTRNAVTDLMQNRRDAIQRQLRLLFVYPIVYIIVWIIPFVAHCFNYSDYYAQHPVFVLSALSTFCQCFMGFADVAIFCWREQPWHHIPGSDGTFLGSFRWWQFSGGRRPVEMAKMRRRVTTADNEVGEIDKSETRTYLSRPFNNNSTGLRTPSFYTNTLSPALQQSHPRTAGPGSVASRGTDRHQTEVECAYERLARERADGERDCCADSQHRQGNAAALPPALISSARKEWWDRATTTGSSSDHELDDDQV